MYGRERKASKSRETIAISITTDTTGLPMEEAKFPLLTKASWVMVRISAFAAAESRSKLLRHDHDPLPLIVKGP